VCATRLRSVGCLASATERRRARANDGGRERERSRESERAREGERE